MRRPPSASPEHRGGRHGWFTSGLALVGTAALFLTLVSGWVEHNLFNSEEFATRAVTVLDSSTARHALAVEITNEIIAEGKPSLGSYRSVLVGVVDDVIDTDGFREIFKAAVRQAHHTIFTKDSAGGLLELAETLRLVSDNALKTSSSLASQLPAATSKLLIDVTPIVHRIRPWRYPNDNRWLDTAAAIVTVAAFAGVVVLDRRRSAFVLIGSGIVAAGLGVVVLAEAIPLIAVSTLHDSAVAAAVGAGVRRFVSDLLTLGLWTIPFGVLLIAAVHGTERRASEPIGARFVRLRERAAALTGGPQIALGAATVLVGALLLRVRDRIVPIAVILVGAVVIYEGAVLLIRGILGANVDAETTQLELNRRMALLAVGGAAAVLLLGFGLVVSVGAARSEARQAGALECNGSPDLCDKRLDHVVFAGSHNSMSSESDPGWLYAEQLHGIPAQLQYGIRALLLKSHYGIDTGIKVAGVPLVVTDRSAEIHADQDAEAQELGPEAVAQVQAIDKAAGTVSRKPELYLCHGYCELGATRFSDTLDQVRRFMDRNPDDVMMMIIGDFVTPGDTADAFRQAGLLSRVWTYDRSKPPPTLREMIRAHRTLLVFSEHEGGTPAWYNPAYLGADAVFQDTPYTFATPAQYSCAVNRGPADAPLFQINHWITNLKPPSAVQAKRVNSYNTLMTWVDRCRKQRGFTPTVLGVNFYDQGDLMRVVDDLNGR